MKFELYLVRIFTSDWERSAAFYRTTLELPEVFSDASAGWAQFSAGAANIGIERVDPADPEGQDLVGRFVGASLQVDDINTAYESLLGRGVEFLGPPVRQPWGGALAHFKDPDGSVLTLLGQ